MDLRSSINADFSEYRKHNLRWFDRWFLTDELEILDTELNSSRVVSIVRDLDRLNCNFWLSKCIVGRIQSSLTKMHHSNGKPPRIIDLCGGFGGLARYLLSWSRQNKIPLEITVLDQSASMIDAAKCELYSNEINWQIGDATSVECCDKEFDLALNVQSLHHFEPELVVGLLQESNRIAKSMFVFDLHRTPLGYVFIQLLRPFYCEELIHDGLISYRRAFTRDEMSYLVRRSEIPASIDPFLSIGYSITSNI
jgi:ubiquinone/menaquinone biosynthesis C-methylase UbiE